LGDPPEVLGEGDSYPLFWVIGSLARQVAD